MRVSSHTFLQSLAQHRSTIVRYIATFQRYSLSITASHLSLQHFVATMGCLHSASAASDEIVQSVEQVTTNKSIASNQSNAENADVNSKQSAVIKKQTVKDDGGELKGRQSKDDKNDTNLQSTSPKKQTPQQTETSVTINSGAHVDKNYSESDSLSSSQLAVNDDTAAFQIREFDINDLDRQSLDSVKTGDSLIFPDHKDIEVLKYTPIRKDTFIKIEDTFWSKKRKLIPDYSVMEEIDKHVLAVSRCFLSRRLKHKPLEKCV